MAEPKIGNLWIIDDDPMSSFYIKRLAELGEFANIITIYDNGKYAIDYLIEHKKSLEHLPDVIFLDIYMPEMDGWAFLEEFAKVKHLFNKQIRIYIITSSDHRQDILRSKQYPDVNDYLQKPVTKEHMKRVVNAR